MLDKRPESLMAYRAGLAGWSWFSNTHVGSFTTQKVKGSDSIELTAVARAYDERIQANSSFSGFSHPDSCLSLLCSLLSPGFLIKLFEIEDKLKTPPTPKKHTNFPAE